jgi:two-component system sensor histidine kinase DegS
VLQEALLNAIKHSGVGKVDALLRGSADRIELTVRDSGTGFDVPRLEGRGLGLTSMKERLKAVQGRLDIRSAPRKGTTVHASVPLVQDGSSTPVHSQPV